MEPCANMFRNNQLLKNFLSQILVLIGKILELFALQEGQEQYYQEGQQYQGEYQQEYQQ